VKADLVRRVLARDTMLSLANDADAAMIVVRKWDREALVVGSESALFQRAVDLFLAQSQASPEPATGTTDRFWSFRSHGFEHAATIIRFCRLMGIDLAPGRDVEELYRSALQELRAESVDGKALDRMAEVDATYRLIRSLRATEKADEAQGIAAALDRPFFEASGAEPRWADIQFEIGACLLDKGKPGQVFKALGELARSYWATTEAKNYSTRHRYGFVLGLAEYAQNRNGAAIQRLRSALTHLHEHRITDTRHDIYELSLTLSLAELHAAAGERADDATSLAETALDIAERVRARWGVIARTRTPLSVAFRRVYGDVALLADELPGARAAALGLRVCMSAKQSGFAAHLRVGEPLLPRAVRGLLTDVIAAEAPEENPSVDPDVLAEQHRAQEKRLNGLHRRIEKWLGPMLADMILPSPTDVTVVQAVLRDRFALDFAGLPDTLTDLNWFRTLIEPNRGIQFERFLPGTTANGLLPDDDARPMEQRLEADPDWRKLATEILPRRLERLLRDEHRDPMELVISPHRMLSLLPWAALQIDDDGTRLVKRAVIAQTPVLTCLAGPKPPVVTEPALVRLVSGTGGVWTDDESDAWGLAPEYLSRVCTVPSAATPPTLSAALSGRDRRWRFLHVAAHGDGSGLGQYIKLPDEVQLGGRLTAAHALGLHWPDSTLMASCKVGLVKNVEYDELLCFVMAVLTGGGRCVIAAVDTVGDLAAGRMAGSLVRLVRSGTYSLDRALRVAQLELADEPVAGWALFNAYVR
jgi:hypothetical protein